CSFSLHTRMGASPPAPFRCGSTTCSTNPPAAAASKALPPRSSTLMAVCEASQWVEEATPKVPVISGRVVKLVMVIFPWSCNKGDGGGPRSGGFRGGGRFDFRTARIALCQDRAHHQLYLVKQHQWQQQRAHGCSGEQHLGHGYPGGQALLGAGKQNGDAIFDAEIQEPRKHVHDKQDECKEQAADDREAEQLPHRQRIPDAFHHCAAE